MMTQRARKERGRYAAMWIAESKPVRLPFHEQMRAIALIADKHPQSQKFLDCLAKIAFDMAIADGVNFD